MNPIVRFAACIAAAPVVALAQAPSAPADTGFFRPQADPALTPVRPATPSAATAPAAPFVAAPAPSPPLPTPAQLQQLQVEQQALDVQRQALEIQAADSAEREARREYERQRLLGNLPAPINGAFTGSTDPRER
jgi:hypothetical protein